MFLDCKKNVVVMFFLSVFLSVFPGKVERSDSGQGSFVLGREMPGAAGVVKHFKIFKSFLYVFVRGGAV